MAAKKTTSKIAKTKAVVNAMPPDPEQIQNGLSGALGFSPFGGVPGFQSLPGTQQISQATTIFDNLRWYLISNFRQVLSEAFAEIAVVQNFVCVPIDDALRGGVMFKSKQLGEADLKKLKTEMKRERDLRAAGWAAKWTRLFGGGAIIIWVDDQDPETELNIAAIGKDTKVEFIARDMWELYWECQNTSDGDDGDPLENKNFEHYSYYGRPLHKSRVMPMKGLEAPSFLRPRLRGWGMSVLEGCIPSVNRYLKTADVIFEVIDEFKVDIYQFEGMVTSLMSATGSQKVKERVQLAQWQKNFQNAIAMDAKDKFDSKQISFAGLAEVEAENRIQLAADLKMPITKLFGTSVSGGFSTDQNDMENYNAMVESEGREKIEFDIMRMAEIRCQQLFGQIPDDLEMEFKPLRELTAVDQETVKTQKYARVSQAKQAGELTTLEYRDACNKGNLFDIQLDTEEDGLSDDPQLTGVLDGTAGDDGEEDESDKKGEEE